MADDGPAVLFELLHSELISYISSANEEKVCYLFFFFFCKYMNFVAIIISISSYFCFILCKNLKIINLCFIL